MARAFDPVQLGSIEQFCKAAELLSFRGAAEFLGITPAAVSRSVSRLEARLGVRLFVRTTRRINLTEDGRTYHEQCRQALTQIDEGYDLAIRQGALDDSRLVSRKLEDATLGIFASPAHLRPRVRAFVDFIADTVTSGSAAISFAA